MWLKMVLYTEFVTTKPHPISPHRRPASHATPSATATATVANHHRHYHRYRILTASLSHFRHSICLFCVLSKNNFSNMTESMLLKLSWPAVKLNRTCKSSLVCITLGILLTVVSPIGGLRNIILQAKDYHIF